LRIALVYNPRMAGHRLGRLAGLVRALEARGDRVSHHDSLTFDCARDAPGAELLCIGGGDGTVRMVVGRQSNLAALPPIAVFPVGTINLVARELGYPKSPRAFIARIEQDRAVLSPLAELNGEAFVACLSVGVDALAVASLSEGLKARIGRLAYVEAMTRLLVKWPLHRLTVRTATEAFEAEALFVLRGRFYAGPWTLHPEAHLGHDALRVLALPRARRRDVVSLAARALGGMRAPHAGWRYLETDWIEVTSDQPVPVQADGDSVGLLPARIEMSAKSVRFR
jgi:diacylglycerol kinase family enzyme